jgi:nucleoporin NUP2
VPKLSFGAGAAPFKVGSSTESQATPAAVPKFSFGTTASQDHTWSPEKGIKFASDASTAAKADSTATEDDSKNPGSLLAAAPFSFGTSSSAPFSFGGSTNSNGAEAPKFSFGGTSTAGTGESAPNVSFGTGTSVAASDSAPKFSFGSASNPFAPAATSNTAVSTQASGATGGEAEGAGDDDSAPAQPQSDLSEKGPGEENEDAVFEMRAKVYKLENKEFKVKGVGPLRILVHRDTKKARVVLRNSTGHVILNVLLRPEFQYKVEGKGQVRIGDISATGDLDTYLVRVKTEADGKTLHDQLNQHKGSA